MEFAEMIQRAMDLRNRYAELERATFGRHWNREEVALGFVGDVGDLMKLVLAKGGVRDIPDAGDRLAHELADCLWSVLVLSQLYGVDLERAFLQTVDELEWHIASRLET
jgi:NTP pyrophosphatase (non-canonical NTP hydrolase)